MKRSLAAFAFIIILSVISPIFGGTDKTLRPYQDYLIVALHGLNDNRTSFVGEQESWSSEMNEQRNVQKHLSETLGIPRDYIRAYSFAESRGSTLYNAQQLGRNEYRRPIGGDLPMMSDLWDSISRQIVGDATAKIAPDPVNREKLIYWSYDPALDKYIPTQVEPGNSILEQARKDWKNWYLNSDLNRDPITKQPILKSVSDPRLEAITPKKIILITHSMGNYSARLYIYSNELAAQGKFFDRGFYNNDIEKVVFLSPPFEGSDLAIATLASPILAAALKVKGLSDVGSKINAKGIGVVQQFLDEFSKVAGNFSQENKTDVSKFDYWKWMDSLRDPLLTLKNPYWAYIYTARYLDMVEQTRDFLGSKAPIETMLGIRGDARFWNPAARELIPDTVNILGQDIDLLGYKMNGPVDIVRELKHVKKANPNDEPLYSIVYGTGYPVLNIESTLTQAIGKGADMLFFKDDPMAQNWILATDPHFQSLTPFAKLASLMWRERFGGVVGFTYDGDAAVPAYSARGNRVEHLKNALRIEKRFSIPELDDFFGNTVPIEMAAVESAAFTSEVFIPGSGDLIRGFGRLGIIIQSGLRAEEGGDKIRYLGGIHGETLAATDEIIRGLLHTPKVTFVDSQYVGASGPWSGIFEVTLNAQASPSIQTKGSSGTTVNGVLAPTASMVLVDSGLAYGTLTSNMTIGVIATNADELILRGVIEDLAPQKLVQLQYSANFSGWADFQSTVEGKWELPFKLYEGQNVIALRAKNRAGYSSNQILKILKTGITLQPVLDEVFPIEGSVTRNPRPKVSLAYQNMKYSDTAANKIVADSLTISKTVGLDSPTGSILSPELINSATQTQVLKNSLNRLEVSYLPTRNLDDGVYQVTVKAHDAYNTSSFIRYTFSVDQTPPAVSILPIAPLNPDTASAAIVVQTQSSDGVNIVIPKTVTTIRNAQNNTIYTASTGTTNTGMGMTSIVPTSSVYPDGTYVVSVEMTDVAGNVGSVTPNEENEVMGEA